MFQSIGRKVRGNRLKWSKCKGAAYHAESPKIRNLRWRSFDARNFSLMIATSGVIGGAITASSRVERSMASSPFDEVRHPTLAEVFP